MFSIEISLVFFIFDGFYTAGSTEYTYFVLEYKMYVYSARNVLEMLEKPHISICY